MARTDINAIVNEADKNISYPIQLIRIELNNDTVEDLYLTTGYKPITFDGNEYTVAHHVLSISPTEETQDIKASALNLQLSGINSNVIQQLETVQTIGGIVTIYQGFWDENLGELVSGTVYIKWAGIINSISTEENNTNSGNIDINIECKSKVGALLNTKNGRHTSQASFEFNNTGDRSMEFVAATVDFNPFFGRDN